MLSLSDKQKIWILYKNEQMSKTDIAAKLGFSRGTVIEVLKHPVEENEQFLDDVKKVYDERNAKLLELIRDDVRLPQTLNKIIENINDTETIKELAKSPLGIKSLMTVYGIITDKHIQAQRMKLDERRVNAQEKMVDIKERELEMRAENPEAFTTVTIIDDSETASDWYKENGNSKPYIKN